MKRRKVEGVYLGIALILISTLAFTLMSALIRSLGERIPLGEIVFSRSLFGLVPLIFMLQWRGELHEAFRLHKPIRHVTRAIAGIGSMFCNFAALSRIPLADATAINFVTPLFNVALAAIFLGEKVRRFRWAAVAVGFAGVLLMLLPHMGKGEWNSVAAYGALLALSAAFLVSAAMTQVRQLATTETTASLVFSFTVLSTLSGLVAMFWGWVVPSGWDAMILVLTGVFGGIGQITVTESYRHAGAGTVAPFAYTSMIYSIILGYAFFGEVPELVVMAGAAIVVLAGLFVLYRERKLHIDRTREREAETPTSAAL
ncbi:MAG TPA: DMT family transporter [Xanthobacteraceae bacterium]|jgi:drug/metabolite transporter (DMT)-like permease|nr:DMT family transporter [Xanthobacteraceae bacterium]